MQNVVIAQSGGPTSVINNTVKGAIDVLMRSKKIDRIFGAKMGILGVLKEELIDISAQGKHQIELLSQTPSAGVLGSCRYKIKSDEDLNRIVEVFKAQNIGYFFYNDDWDYSIRARKAGFKIFYYPDAVVYHKVSISTQKSKQKEIWWQYFGMSTVRFYKKHRNQFELNVYIIWFIIRELIKLNINRIIPFLKVFR